MPFLPLAGCALAKVAVAHCADAGFGCCLQCLSMGGGEKPNQTEFKHLRTMGSRRNGGVLEPIQSHSALADVGHKDVSWWQKVVARQKVSKVLSFCLGVLETDVRRVQWPDGHTALEGSCSPGSLNLKCLLPTFNLLSCQCNFHCSQLALLWPK